MILIDQTQHGFQTILWKKDEHEPPKTCELVTVLYGTLREPLDCLLGHITRYGAKHGKNQNKTILTGFRYGRLHKIEESMKVFRTKHDESLQRRLGYFNGVQLKTENDNRGKQVHNLCVG
ncbi:hypothetical protein CDAR_81581 [Caerostris darwini]|uniref:Uncharacterized protein n=1 Tax=Caerostris darwini TaxID=1538125 RepID=A0AAV4VX61_9ARAC|nr:hypothetical protein CDAR_81581 [Caerostris darwini]